MDATPSIIFLVFLIGFLIFSFLPAWLANRRQQKLEARNCLYSFDE